MTSSFPPGSVVLHIGPPKTGTTSLQKALDGARERLAELGVALPGGTSNPAAAANGGTGMFTGSGYEKAWAELVAAVDQSEARVQVVSCEQFAYARASDAHRIAAELGGSRVRIVVTLRPLVEILPSRWQQFVQSGETASYDDWLKTVLSEPPVDEHSDRFLTQLWQLRFIERWAAAVGPENVTVIVVDRDRPESLLTDFAELLGVGRDVLRPVGQARNDSLRFAEIEMLRGCYAELAEHGWEQRRSRSYMLYGAAARMRETRPQRPGPRDIVTPVWAQERAEEMGAELAERLPSTGVQIVGDPAALTGEVVSKETEAATLDPSAPVQAIVGVVRIAEAKRDRIRELLGEEKREAERTLKAERDQAARMAARLTEALDIERQRRERAESRSAERRPSAELLKLVVRRITHRLRLR